MWKVHPQVVEVAPHFSDKETYTMWMKSLVFHGNGCTVFNSRGQVVFRVDNYQNRRRGQVFLMDPNGRALFTLNKKRLRMYECWEGFAIRNGDHGIDDDEKVKSVFRVRRNHTFWSKNVSCKVAFDGCESGYEIAGFEGKPMLKITDYASGQILAEAVQKQTQGGVSLGEDVLTLTVERHANQSLILALITAYGLMNKKL